MIGAIVQAALCAGIFISVGLLYKPDTTSRDRLKVSLIAFAICALTGMQFMSLVGRLIIEGVTPEPSWFNTGFYFLTLCLVLRARGNVAKIWPAGFERWNGQERRRRMAQRG